MKDILDSYDAQFLSHFNLDLVVSCQSNIGVDQDPSTFTLRMTGNDCAYALIYNRNILGKTRYASKGNSIDYDRAGDYHVTNIKARSIVYDGKLWKVRSEYDDIAVKSTGEAMLSSNALSPHIDLFPPNHQDPSNLFFRYLLSLGRGYSQLLDTITSSSLAPDGVATISGPGSLFSSDKGTWRMEVDTEHDYLVRSAVFTLPNQTIPVFKCQSNQYWEAEMPLYANGDLEFPIRDYKMTTKLMRYMSEYDNSIYNESMNSVTKYPPTTSIMDFSRLDADKVPFVVSPLPKDLAQETLD